MRLEGIILSRSARQRKTTVFVGIFDQNRWKNGVSPDSGKTKSRSGLKPLYLQAFLIKTGRKTASREAA